MTQTQRVSGVKTDILTDEKGTHVSYRGTAVVSFNDKTITLRSNGWETVTTKRRMTQASNQFGLGFSVYSLRGVWCVRLPNGTETKYIDGMTFDRIK